jgi:hypothetical protein
LQLAGRMGCISHTPRGPIHAPRGPIHTPSLCVVLRPAGLRGRAAPIHTSRCVWSCGPQACVAVLHLPTSRAVLPSMCGRASVAELYLSIPRAVLPSLCVVGRAWPCCTYPRPVRSCLRCVVGRAWPSCTYPFPVRSCLRCVWSGERGRAAPTHVPCGPTFAVCGTSSGPCPPVRRTTAPRLMMPRLARSISRGWRSSDAVGGCRADESRRSSADGS